MKGSEKDCVPPNIEDSFLRLRDVQKYYSEKGNLPQEHPLTDLSQADLTRIQFSIRGEFYTKHFILSSYRGFFVDLKKKVSGSGRKLLRSGFDAALVISRRNPFSYNSINGQ